MSKEVQADVEEIKVFLEEAEEQIQALETNLLRLEGEAESGEVIQELFRAAHTLKGASATLGHQRLTALTHAMEGVLDKLRKGTLISSSEVVDLLFESVDYLRIITSEISTGEEAQVDISNILARLRSVGEGPGRLSVVPDLEAQQRGQDIEKLIQAGLSKGMEALTVLVKFAPDAIMPAVRAFQVVMILSELGELVWSDPTVDQIEREAVEDQLKALFLTKQGRETIRSALASVPDVVSIEIKRYEQLVPLSRAGGPEAAEEPISGKRIAAHTVRVDVQILDNLMDLVGELVIDRTRLLELLTSARTPDGFEQVLEELNRTAGHIGRVTTQLQEEIMRTRMVPLETLFRKFPRMVRDLAQASGKNVELIIKGEETELDRSVIEQISDPLIHLIRNAVDHGIEPPEERAALGKPTKGKVTVTAWHEENHIVISVADDGKGLDAEAIKNSAVQRKLITADVARKLSEKEALDLIFLPGLSTATRVTEVSGRGVGMDVVRRNVEKLNGNVRIKSIPRVGTEFTIELPLTLLIIRALMVRCGEEVYAFPLSLVSETIALSDSNLSTIRGREVIVIRGKVIPILRLRDLFEVQGRPDSRGFAVIASVGGRQVAFGVDDLIGEQEVVVKNLGTLIGDVGGIAGATILGDGRVALIIDVPRLVSAATKTQAVAEEVGSVSFTRT